MHTAEYALLLFGALAGGFISGLAGFGTALIALGIWLYVLPPTSAVQLVLICSIVAQSATLPSMWKRFDLGIAWPFVVGGLAGVPIGTLLVAQANPLTFKFTVGVLLLLFSVALHFNRGLPAVKFGGRTADGAIGIAGGILGGLAGLSGPLPILWATLRGWSKDERRGVYQLYNWSVLTVAFVLQLASGLVAPQMIWLTLIALPGTLIGAWLGTRAYHAMSDRNFTDAVLVLLFISGLGLLWSTL
jgi:uncharacterized membrane protein YfcA